MKEGLSLKMLRMGGDQVLGLTVHTPAPPHPCLVQDSAAAASGDGFLSILLLLHQLQSFRLSATDTRLNDQHGF